MKTKKRPHKPEPIIITFASSKGGCGKSTSCAAVAGALAARKYAVTIIDLDENKTLHRWYTTHMPGIPRLAVVAATPDTFNDTLESARSETPDYILIDIAGAYEATMIKAIARSRLVITPAKLSEPDLREAGRILEEVNAFNERFGSTIGHRVLVNEAEPLDPMYQRHALAELDDSRLVRFSNLMLRRAPYREIFIGGMPPHFSDQGRAPIRKAIEELDALVDEIRAIVDVHEQEKAA